MRQNQQGSQLGLVFLTGPLFFLVLFSLLGSGSFITFFNQSFFELTLNQTNYPVLLGKVSLASLVAMVIAVLWLYVIEFYRFRLGLGLILIFSLFLFGAGFFLLKAPLWFVSFFEQNLSFVNQLNLTKSFLTKNALYFGFSFLTLHLAGWLIRLIVKDWLFRFFLYPLIAFLFWAMAHQLETLAASGKFGLGLIESLVIYLQALAVFIVFLPLHFCFFATFQAVRQSLNFQPKKKKSRFFKREKPQKEVSEIKEKQQSNTQEAFVDEPSFGESINSGTEFVDDPRENTLVLEENSGDEQQNMRLSKEP